MPDCHETNMDGPNEIEPRMKPLFQESATFSPLKMRVLSAEKLGVHTGAMGSEPKIPPPPNCTWPLAPNPVVPPVGLWVCVWVCGEAEDGAACGRAAGGEERRDENIPEKKSPNAENTLAVFAADSCATAAEGASASPAQVFPTPYSFPKILYSKHAASAWVGRAKNKKPARSEVAASNAPVKRETRESLYIHGVHKSIVPPKK